MPIWTLGHSHIPIARLNELLMLHSIDTIVDARSQSPIALWATSLGGARRTRNLTSPMARLMIDAWRQPYAIEMGSNAAALAPLNICEGRPFAPKIIDVVQGADSREGWL
jgi:hypothetical protein